MPLICVIVSRTEPSSLLQARYEIKAGLRARKAKGWRNNFMEEEDCVSGQADGKTIMSLPIPTTSESSSSSNIIPAERPSLRKAGRAREGSTSRIVPQDYKGFLAGVFSGIAKLSGEHLSLEIPIRLSTAYPLPLLQEGGATLCLGTQGIQKSYFCIIDWTR